MLSCVNICDFYHSETNALVAMGCFLVFLSYSRVVSDMIGFKPHAFEVQQFNFNFSFEFFYNLALFRSTSLP